MSVGFSLKLRKEVNSIWERFFTHPFLTEMKRAALPLDKFEFYVKQDYAFLIEFARCLGIATAKVKNRDTMSVFAKLLIDSLTVEVKMLERLSEKVGVSPDELRNSEPAPTNVAYTRHLLHVAYSGTVGETVASLLPCMWSYEEIGNWLGDSVALKRHSIYSEWSDTYRSQEYIDLVKLFRDLVDHQASVAGVSEKGKMRNHFYLSSRYEYMFWNMAYKKETWPL